jgi:hypothetical protein
MRGDQRVVAGTFGLRQQFRPSEVPNDVAEQRECDTLGQDQQRQSDQEA